jgi:hypothetical protein
MLGMRIILVLLLLVSCSTEKKSRKVGPVANDNDERVSHDWNKDGYPETIIITPYHIGEEYRELAIYRGVPEGMASEKIFSNRSLIPARARPGGKLRLQKDHSVFLTVDSSGSGRTQEVITWKINWKRGRYLITGVTRDWSDKLDPNDHQSCDLDLRGGRGFRNGKPLKFEPFTIDLIDLNERFVPAACEF